MRKQHLLILAALTACQAAKASTICVPGDYGTIQEALSEAQTGDTVLVAPGTYTENIVWPDVADLILISEQGPDQTIIDGDSSGTVITLLSPLVDTTTVITGFTVRNGAAAQGGGFRCSGASPKIIANTIEECYAVFDGAGLYCANSRAVIEGNTIRNNIAGVQYQGATRDHTNGGGICFTGNSSGLAVIKDNIITDNCSTDYGAGITCTRNALISGNQISNNVSGWFGGGIYHLGASTTLEENLISGNTSLWGAGITLQGGHLTIFKCEILNNIGDGVHIYYGTLDADSSTFANNTRDGIGAGAGKQSDSRGASVTHCNITGNGNFGIRSSNEWLAFDATLNWWGDSSGPGGVGPGTGDKVSRYIDYDPWLTHLGISSESQNEGLSEKTGLLVQNPVRSSTIVQVSGNGPAELCLVDNAGRIVKTLYNGVISGSHLINWNTSDIAPGLYFLRFAHDNSMSIERVVVIR